MTNAGSSKTLIAIGLVAIVLSGLVVFGGPEPLQTEANRNASHVAEGSDLPDTLSTEKLTQIDNDVNDSTIDPPDLRGYSAAQSENSEAEAAKLSDDSKTLNPAALFNSDYLSYDAATIQKLADGGDLVALQVASLRRDLFDLETRERYAVAAAEQGDYSGFVRMFFDYLPTNDNEDSSDVGKAYGYLLAARQLDLAGVEDADLGGIQDLTADELRQAIDVMEDLVAKTMR